MVESMVQLGRGFENAGVEPFSVAMAMMLEAVDDAKVLRGSARRGALDRVAKFATLAKDFPDMGNVLMNAAATNRHPAAVLHALLHYLTGKDAWRLLGDLRRGWSEVEEGSLAHQVLLMYAALDQEAVDANQARPVIEETQA